MSDKQGTPILPPLNRGASSNGGANNGGTSQQTVSLQQVLATAQGLNVLATGSGQQFVITTQVPGLTQVCLHCLYVPFVVFCYLSLTTFLTSCFEHCLTFIFNFVLSIIK